MHDRSTSRPGGRGRRRPRLASLGLLVTVGVLAAGCGGDAAGGASSADPESEARDAALNHAQCMREHGVDMPDPSFDGGGIKQTGPDKDVPRAKLDKADEACEKYQEEIEPPKLSDEEQQEFKEAALAHSRCMREHGLEKFPDPTFGGNGEAMIRMGPGTGLDPEDPDFQEAEKACEDTMPQESAP